MRLTISTADAGVRLDRLLLDRLRLGRPAQRTLAASGRLRLDGRALLAGAPRLCVGATVEILDATCHPELLPEAIALEILHETDALLVINKPAGLPVHPGPGHPAGTLANALRALGRPLSTLDGPLRPGLVHRLDVGTSGAIVIAKHDGIHRLLTELFASRVVHKEYLALTRGVPDWTELTVNAPIARKSNQRKAYTASEHGKPACTHLTTLAAVEELALLLARPVTGRTHQIRVHLAHVGLPILGDTLYGGGSPAAAEAARYGLARPALHAARIVIPALGLDVRAPLPADIERVHGACGIGIAI